MANERKDYYKILGLTEEDKKLPKEEFLKKLSKNFKKLAVQYHPDRNPGDKEAEEKFKEINEANQVLSDYDGKKAEYDNPMSHFQFTGNMDMDEILRHFQMNFGDDFGFGNFGFGGGQQVYQKGSSIRGTVSVSLEDVLNGATKKVRFTRKKVCKKCHGTGKDENSREEICPHCQGHGFIAQGYGFMSVRSTCPYCGGVGRIVINPCKTCGGSGLEDEVVEKSFSIPKGIPNGMTLVMSGLGNQIPGDGNVPGDLNITVIEKPHPIFQRSENNLIMVVNVGVIDAILGTKLRITTLNGKRIDLNIPRGSEEGKRLIVNGYGLPSYNNNTTGDLICVVHIVMPKKLTEKEVKALEKLNKSESFKK